MANLNSKNLEELLDEWWKNHDTKEGSTVRNKALGSVKVGSKKKEFIITRKLFDNTSQYYVAFGYYANNDELLCRIFYKSKSESEWRVFTGLRSDAQWVKGAEINSEMRGGYIGEGMIQFYLSNFINNIKICDEFNDKTSDNKDLKITLALVNAAKAVDAANAKKNDHKNICKYLLHPDYEIQHIYAKEREFDPDYLKEITNKASDSFHKYAQPKILMSVSSNKNSTTDLARKIKEDDALWGAIKSCLNNNIVGSYEFKHDLLDSDCICNIYKIDSNHPTYACYVEIAREKTPRNIRYKSNTGFEYTANTPICWVKNVYLNDNNNSYAGSGESWGEITSFGNYKRYAEDLWFLVQKPIEYIVQSYNLSEAGPGEVDAAKFSPMLSRMGIDAKVKGGTQMGAKIDPYKNTINSYVYLALYNEKYSPLIQEYKIRHKFTLFKSTSQKYSAGQLTIFIDALKDDSRNNNSLEGIISLMKTATGQYKTLNKNNRSKKAGNDRADKFMELLDMLEDQKDKGHPLTYRLLGDCLFNLFSNNTISFSLLGAAIGNNAPRNDVGYSNIYQKIQTSESSLFTIVAGNLLKYVEFTSLLESALSSNNTKYRDIFDLHRTNHHSLARFYIKALDLKANDKNVGTHSAQLLKAIKKTW